MPKPPADAVYVARHTGSASGAVASFDRFLPFGAVELFESAHAPYYATFWAVCIPLSSRIWGLGEGERVTPYEWLSTSVHPLLAVRLSLRPEPSA